MAVVSSFHRLATWTTAATYFLILVGGLVRASGAGLGCPDWPRCFGSWIPPSSPADLPPQFDPSLFNPTLMWTEYLNRLLGVSVGLLILATVVSAWRHHRHEPRILWSSVAALLLTGFQGWLGGRVVAHELAAWIVTVHMIVALVIVQLLLYATVATRPHGAATTGTPRTPVTRATLSLILVTMIQIAIGTQVRGAVDVALDGGVPRAGAVASVGMLDHLHRGAALAVFAGSLMMVLWLGSRVPGERTLIRWAYVVAGLATAQVGLGVVMTYVSLLPAAQVGHLVVASVLLGAETVLLLLGRTESVAAAFPLRDRRLPRVP
ncbi:MAG TPA: COX15/CtaA family protein [Vicinamibacterales bacterium]|nr:COX15/CtaA family protein [Vicinamibacterales bacterium]